MIKALPPYSIIYNVEDISPSLKDTRHNSKNDILTMDLVAQAKVETFEDSKKVAKIRSGDEDEVDVSSRSSDNKVSSKTTTKSIGIRRIEILQKQYQDPFFVVWFFFCIFLVAFGYRLDAMVRGKLQYYATSSYNKHSLFAAVTVMQSVISAAAQPCYARLSDRFGRLELCILAIVFYSMGTVIQSQAYDINRFAGGSVIYEIGNTGFSIMLQVILADFSNLNWRLLCVFIPAMPLIIITWVGGDVVDSVVEHYSWNWGIGMWAFIFPLSAVPLLGCLIHMQIKARKTPEWQEMTKEINSQRKHSKKSLAYWKTLVTELFWDLDVVGLLHVILILGLILVPFTLAGGVTSKWARASTIVPLVIGVVLIPVFVMWEAKFARSPIMPLPLMKDRGVWSALLIAIFLNWIWYMPNDFMYTVLIVGLNASVKAATRITSLYSFVGTIVGPLLGLVVVRVRRLKIFIIFGCICWAVSLGILFHFRGANDGIESEKYLDGVIGGLCFMGFGGGFLNPFSIQVSITTVTNHEYMSVILSLFYACYFIGSSIGASISGAIWTNKMYDVILDKMQSQGVPNAVQLAKLAYEAPFDFIVTNTWGSPARIAVATAYAHVQRYLCITGLVLCFPLIIVSFVLRDHRLDSVQSLDMDHDQEQGVVKDGKVVVNNYDDDIILDRLKSFSTSVRSRWGH